MSKAWPIDYDNHGNGSFYEWLTVGPVEIHGSDGGRLTEDDRAMARKISAFPALLEAAKAAVRTYKPGIRNGLTEWENDIAVAKLEDAIKLAEEQAE